MDVLKVPRLEDGRRARSGVRLVREVNNVGRQHFELRKLLNRRWVLTCAERVHKTPQPRVHTAVKSINEQGKPAGSNGRHLPTYGRVLLRPENRLQPRRCLRTHEQRLGEARVVLLAQRLNEAAHRVLDSAHRAITPEARVNHDVRSP